MAIAYNKYYPQSESCWVPKITVGEVDHENNVPEAFRVSNELYTSDVCVPLVDDAFPSQVGFQTNLVLKRVEHLLRLQNINS